MNHYKVTYTDTFAEEVTADTIELSDGHYIGYRDNKPIAYIPAKNVRSIIRQDATEQADV
ncbi:hypothetical protein [Streptomyces griseosporeus]